MPDTEDDDETLIVMRTAPRWIRMRETHDTDPANSIVARVAAA